MTKLLFPIAAILIAASPAAFAQKRELQELQRDIAILQDEMRSSIKSQNERLVGLEATLKTMLDQINATNRAVTVLDSNLRSRVEASVVKPMAGVGAKVDGLQEDFRYVRETVTELSSKLSKLSSQVSDLDNALRTMQAPPAPPSGVGGMAPSANSAPQGVTAQSLYQDAMRDKSAGNADLALRQFNDYLSWFGTTDLAPNSQYYIGEIHYNQKEYDKALQAFDAVLERYPKNAKTVDARFMKGRSLVRLGQRTEGAEEFRGIIAESPNSELARRSRDELKSLGLSTGAPASRPAGRRR